MTRFARKISHNELSSTLPLLALTQIRNDVLEACADTADEGGPLPVGVEFWEHDGILDALQQADHVEAGFDHGDGVLLAEFVVGPVFQRCLACGRSAPEADSSWCSQRCRNLLRALGRRQSPGVPDGEALAAVEKWATIRRNSAVGWWGPLTREIAEALYGPGR